MERVARIVPAIAEGQEAPPDLALHEPPRGGGERFGVAAGSALVVAEEADTEISARPGLTQATLEAQRRDPGQAPRDGRDVVEPLGREERGVEVARSERELLVQRIDHGAILD